MTDCERGRTCSVAGSIVLSCLDVNKYLETVKEVVLSVAGTRGPTESNTELSFSNIDYYYI